MLELAVWYPFKTIFLDHSTGKHLCLFSHGGSHVTAWAEGKLRINFA